MNFNLLYPILQKALGKSTESHLNTRCWQPANRIPELCTPITRAHPGSRDLFTPADPRRPTRTPRPQLWAPRRHLPVPNARAGSDWVQAVPTDPEGPPPWSRGAKQGGLWARGAPTPPQLPWGPGPASSPCCWWLRTWSQGPSQARALRGWRSQEPLAGGGAR